MLLCSPALTATAASADSLPEYRIFALNRQGAAAELNLRQFVAELAAVDVVVLGEYHDDAASHRMQLELLRQLAAVHQDNLALTMEMFERDVQDVIDEYWQGRISEEMFLEQSRPWKNYPTDYRPLAEFARSRGIPLIAANPPTALARKVAREGMDSMYAALADEEQAWIAAETSAPEDAYWQRFFVIMGGGDTTHGGMDEARIRQFYAAQCLKDDTMAETIVAAARWWLEPQETGQSVPLRRTVLHVNGSFHSDYGHGVPLRVRQRAPELSLRTVAMRPVADFRLPSAGGNMDPHGDTLPDGSPVADYVIFVPAPPKQEQTAQ